MLRGLSNILLLQIFILWFPVEEYIRVEHVPSKLIPLVPNNTGFSIEKINKQIKYQVVFELVELRVWNRGAK